MSAPARPTLVKRKAIFAFSLATRRSDARAMTAPAPAAVPLSAATTGLRSARMFLIRSHVMRVNSTRPGMSREKSSLMMSC